MEGSGKVAVAGQQPLLLVVLPAATPFGCTFVEYLFSTWFAKPTGQLRQAV